jgi:hypothetical protein
MELSSCGRILDKIVDGKDRSVGSKGCDGPKKSPQVEVAVVSGVFGGAILDVHVPLGWLAEGAPPFDPDRVLGASGFSSIGCVDVPVPECR